MPKSRGVRKKDVLYKQTLTFGTAFRADCEAPYQEEVSSEYPYLSAIRQLKQKDKLSLRSTLSMV